MPTLEHSLYCFPTIRLPGVYRVRVNERSSEAFACLSPSRRTHMDPLSPFHHRPNALIGLQINHSCNK